MTHHIDGGVLGSARSARLRMVVSSKSPFGSIRLPDEPLVLPSALPERSDAGPVERLASLDAAFDAFKIGDGATLSFHHHYRNGDLTAQAVLEVARRRGLKGLTLALSSIFPAHDALADLVEEGVVTAIVTDYAKGRLADAVTAGSLPSLMLFQSHGGRARAIASGALSIDVAFVAAPLADTRGNTTGRGGRLACGPLGYAMTDAAYAKRTVVLADTISEALLPRIDIPADQVDALIHWPDPGLPDGIQSGTTAPVDTPATRHVSAEVVSVIKAAGLLTQGFSFQTGAGGYSLAAVPHIGDAMRSAGITGAFVSGGITGPHVAIAEGGLMRRIRDVQCFDTEAVRSACENANHEAMSVAAYASLIHPAPAVDELSVMLLGAVEIDRAFNVNVVVGGDGRVIGGPGGHPDAAAGAKLSIVTTGLIGGGYAKVVDEVRCVATPGESVDVLVTDAGIAVNPARSELALRLREGGVPLVDIGELIETAAALAEREQAPQGTTPVALVEARDGRILDAISNRPG